LVEIGEEIHDGWVSYSFKDAPVATKYLRFQGSRTGSCRVGQVKVIGKEVIDDNNPSFACPVELNLNGVTYATGQVIYDGAVTPKLDSIVPRFGSVLGGETIVLNGSNFFPVTTIITIDGRDCAFVSGTSTSITCITSDKPYKPGNPTLTISLAGIGNVAT